MSRSGCHAIVCFVVTTDSELSDNESELSSLDIRIREALARPTNFSQSIRSQATKPSADIVKPVAKVSMSCLRDSVG